MDKKIKVLITAAEGAPLAKVGGLADVIGSLPQALNKNSVDARVMLPFYESIDKNLYKPELIKKDIPIIAEGKQTSFDLFLVDHKGTKIYLIYNKEYISQGEVYTWSGHETGAMWEKERFLFFTESIIEALPHLEFWPDILHLQDWHTGLVPKFLSFKALADPHYKSIKTIFTIHNISSQGQWNLNEILPMLDMTIQDFDKKDIPKNDINAMLFGIRHSDLVTTVSPNYSREILTKKYGLGMEKALKKRKNTLFGVLNGIDIEKFNPVSNPDIYNNFDIKSLESKELNKQKLIKELGFEDDGKALIGVVSRLVYQKGIDWILGLVPKLKKLNANLVLLGTGSEDLEKSLNESAKKHPENFKALIKFDASLAQKIYAGSDMFLIPSRFEPCGLTQMISMRYGTVPIARSTGGLTDTIQNYSHKNNRVYGNGFLFNKENAKALTTATTKALSIYKDKAKWQALQKNCMKQDFSWDKSAREYIDLYKKLLNN